METCPRCGSKMGYAEGGEVEDSDARLASALRERLDASIKRPALERVAGGLGESIKSAVDTYRDFPLRVKFPRGGIKIDYKGHF